MVTEVLSSIQFPAKLAGDYEFKGKIIPQSRQDCQSMYDEQFSSFGNLSIDRNGRFLLHTRIGGKNDTTSGTLQYHEAKGLKFLILNSNLRKPPDTVVVEESYVPNFDSVRKQYFNMDFEDTEGNFVSDIQVRTKGDSASDFPGYWHEANCGQLNYWLADRPYEVELSKKYRINHTQQDWDFRFRYKLLKPHSNYLLVKTNFHRTKEYFEDMFWLIHGGKIFPRQFRNIYPQTKEDFRELRTEPYFMKVK